MQIIQQLAAFLDKLANEIGLESALDHGVKFRDVKKSLKDYMGNPNDLTEYLPYRAFNENNHLFLLDGDFKGFIFEVFPIVGVNDSIEQSLEHFFTDELPENIYFQVLLLASNDVSLPIKNWQHGRGVRDELLDKFAYKRIEFLLKKASNFDPESIIPRNYRFFICISQKKGTQKKLLDFQNQILKKFSTLELLPKLLDAQEVISLVSEILALDPDSLERPTYNKFDLLNRQMIMPGVSHSLSSDHVKTNDNIVTKIFQVTNYPRQFSLSQMIELLGSHDKDTLSIPGRFFISFTAVRDISQACTSSTIAGGRALIKSAEQFYSRHNTVLVEEAREWMTGIHGLESGNKLLTTSLLIGLTCHADKMENAQSSLVTLYNTKGFKIKPANHIHLIGLLSCLPLSSCYYFDQLKYFRLTEIRMSSEISSLLPLHGEWKGIPEPGMLLIGRRGQLFNWNPFYRIASGNYNVCIFGPSGSGKSVFLQDMAQNMISQGVKIFVLDIGQSFKNLCMLLNGQMIRFSQEMDISVSPFGNSFTSLIDDLNEGSEDRSDLLLNVINIVASMAGVKADPFKNAIIEQAVDRAIRDKELSVTGIAKALQDQNTKESIDLSHALFPYTARGRYGKYFDRDSNVTFNKLMTVFEFEEIRNDLNLLAVMLQIISMQIFLQVFKSDRNSRFMIIVDEAWMILDYAAKFLSDLARTIRKYGGSLVVCVQNYGDFQKSEEHKSIFSNSTWTVILKQDEKDLGTFRDSEAFSSMMPLLRSISFKPGRFSECLIYTTSVRVVGRLALDSYAGTLYSTDSRDFGFIKAETDKGSSIDQAVEKLIAHKNR